MTRCLLAIGSAHHGDDGVAADIGERLVGTDWIVIDAGISPENTTGQVARLAPELLVIVDAAEMNEAPGTVRRLSVRTMDRMLASTHGLPLSFLIERMARAAGEIVLLGVQPAHTGYETGLSPAVQAASQAIADRLRRGDVQGAFPWLETPAPSSAGPAPVEGAESSA
jgi:hydrogenase 3 maturation protease